MGRRKRELEVPGLVAVEGAPATGKTALARRWADAFGARIIELEAKENPFLDEGGVPRAGRAFSSRMYALLARHQLQDELRQEELFSGRTVVDGLLQRELVYAEALLPEKELLLFRRIYELLETQAVTPDLVVLLHARVDRLEMRLRARRLTPSEAVERSFLDRISRFYASSFEGKVDAPIVTLDVTTIDFDEDEELLDKAVEAVRRASLRLGPGDREALRLKGRP